MTIISTELRLKDIDWTEKMIDLQKKTTRSAGNNSLEDKRKKEDLATMEKVLHHIKELNRDVRKGDWNSKEVRTKTRLREAPLEDDKESIALDHLTQLVDAPILGVT